jgi:small-conductance mechanosensitive channel
MSSIWAHLTFAFSHPVYSKLIAAVIIVIAALIATRIINLIMSRWRKRVVSRQEKGEPGAISPAETKIDMLRRLVNIVVYFLAFVIFLFQFPQIRGVGTTILASAGVLTIVIGMAAQSTLSNVIAGIALSFSQPVRLNDAVIYNNDWGWVEEITLMHTIIRTWDNRRLMVPNSIMNNSVVQNWTIKDSWLLAIVMVYVDYTCDVVQIREWVKQIVDESPYTTAEKIAVIQVVDFTEKSMVLRILGKSWDSSNTWNLRCDIREKLIKKFQEAGIPLPQIRINEEISAHSPDRQRRGNGYGRDINA